MTVLLSLAAAPGCGRAGLAGRARPTPPPVFWGRAGPTRRAHGQPLRPRKRGSWGRPVCRPSAARPSWSRSRGAEREDGLQFVPAARGQVSEKLRRVPERNDGRYHVLPDRAAVRLQQVDRLGGEALPVPGVRQAPRYPADLGAPYRQAVVVELGAEPQLGCPGLVEGQIDD